MRKRPRVQDVLETIAQYSIGFKKRKGQFGEVIYDDMQIWIHPDLTVREKLDTLIHEGIHAWYHSRGMTQTEKKVLEDTARILGACYD